MLDIEMKFIDMETRANIDNDANNEVVDVDVDVDVIICIEAWIFNKDLLFLNFAMCFHSIPSDIFSMIIFLVAMSNCVKISKLERGRLL